ncbi:MAG TPA: class I SAM-dependent methyltransferase [Gammaproteobacteria bacterium]|nr:class I SAM-dependent methyltransferase [Gammaproteobacteria bacterium]
MTDLFAEKAEDWDRRDVVRALSEAIGSAMVEQVPFAADMAVMDFGAGTGLITAQVAPRVGQMVGVDTSPAMLEKLAAKSELQGRVETVCQDILEQPLARTFDAIVSAMALHHVEDTDRLIATFARHLKPEGWLALADLDTEDGTFHPEDVEGVFHHGFDRDELAERLSSQGFTNIRFTTAHEVHRDGKTYPVFLVTARKSD